jgi:dienelactone hydrolase
MINGVYDLAGNVKEWCFNEAPEGYRVMAGGGWKEAPYMFGSADKFPPFSREDHFGFRCMKPLQDDGVWKDAAKPVQFLNSSVPPDRKPCSDELFQAYKRQYDYNKSALQAKIESAEDISPDTRREKVSFNAAYGNETMIVYLYLPRTGKSPFQTVVYWPGSDAQRLHSEAEYCAELDTFESHTKNGRAFVFPVLQGTFERMPRPGQQVRTTFIENEIMCVKDVRRTLDYLETRPEEFDIKKIAYEGLSWGGYWGGVLPAIETRIKVAVLISGSLSPGYPDACSQYNFAPRIKIPILMQNGRYDAFYPVESRQQPLLKLFGTPEEDKKLRNYETGHAVWLKNEMRKDELDFLDKYLGPVK